MEKPLQERRDVVWVRVMFIQMLDQERQEQKSPGAPVVPLELIPHDLQQPLYFPVTKEPIDPGGRCISEELLAVLFSSVGKFY